MGRENGVKSLGLEVGVMGEVADSQRFSWMLLSLPIEKSKTL